MRERQQRREGFLSNLAPSALSPVTARSHHFVVHAGLEVVSKFMQTDLKEADARQEVDSDLQHTPYITSIPNGHSRAGDGDPPHAPSCPAWLRIRYQHATSRGSRRTGGEAAVQ